MKIKLLLVLAFLCLCGLLFGQIKPGDSGGVNGGGSGGSGSGAAALGVASNGVIYATNTGTISFAPGNNVSISLSSNNGVATLTINAQTNTVTATNAQPPSATLSNLTANSFTGYTNRIIVTNGDNIVVVSNGSTAGVIAFGPSLTSNVTVRGSQTNENTNGFTLIMSKAIQRRSSGDPRGIGVNDFQSTGGSGGTVAAAAQGNYSGILAGGGNSISTNAANSVIGGGIDNRIETFGSFIGGGNDNVIYNIRTNGTLAHNIIGNGSNNSIDEGYASFLGGGLNNLIGDTFGTTSNFYAVLVGGARNETDSDFGTILGGSNSVVSASAIGGMAIGSRLTVGIPWATRIGYENSWLQWSPTGGTNSSNFTMNGRVIIPNLPGSGTVVSWDANGLFKTNITSGTSTNALWRTNSVDVGSFGTIDVTNSSASLLASLSGSVLTLGLLQQTNFVVANIGTINLTNALGSNQVRLGLQDLTNVVASAPSNGDVLSWNSTMKKWTNVVSSGVPAGSTTWVQYNNGGVFGAEAAFNYDSGDDILSVGQLNSYTLSTTNATIYGNLKVPYNVTLGKVLTATNSSGDTAWGPFSTAVDDTGASTNTAVQIDFLKPQDSYTVSGGYSTNISIWLTNTYAAFPGRSISVEFLTNAANYAIQVTNLAAQVVRYSPNLTTNGYPTFVKTNTTHFSLVFTMPTTNYVIGDAAFYR